MKNRIVIALLSLIVMFSACKKDDPQPPYNTNQGPDVTIEKITNTNQLIEGSNDTVFFKVKLSTPFQNVHQATMANVLIYYGDTTAINDVDLFVYDQTGAQQPEYEFYAENFGPQYPLGYLQFYSVNFYPGDQERIVGIKSKENSIYEKDKVYLFNVVKVYYPLIFGSYVDYYDGKNIQVSYNYVDNDLMPVIGFDHGITTSIQVQESAGNGQSARIKLTNRSGFPIPVNYSVSGSAIADADYIIKSPNSLLIKPGEYYYDFNFDVVNDNITEGTESFTIKLLSADKALIGSTSNNSIFLRDSIQVFINE